MRLAQASLTVLAIGLAAGCANDGGMSSGDDSPGDAGRDGSSSADAVSDTTAGPFALTSPTITEGGAIPSTHACASKGGLNQSPALMWTNAPIGTQSFAITFIDLSNGSTGGYPHGTIYNIPASRTDLPANIDKVYAPTAVDGARQSPSYDPQVKGWNGPCPPSEHTYQLKLYALNASMIAGATQMTASEDLITLMSGITLATATLTANFDPTP